MDADKEVLSESGKYKALFREVKREGFFAWSRCFLIDVETEEFISVINRNYSAYPYAFAEDHADGHDYFLFGNDYQGQTVVQLDTGLRRDHLPKSAQKGWGFCWADIDVFEKELRVEGCYWGAPYEIVTYDFSDPMALPYQELSREDLDE